MLEEMVDPGGRSQEEGIWQPKDTVPGGQNKHLYRKSRTELLLLYGMQSKLTVVDGLPPGCRRDNRGERSPLDRTEIHKAKGVIHHSRTRGYRGQQGGESGRKVGDGPKSDIPSPTGRPGNPSTTPQQQGPAESR